MSFAPECQHNSKPYIRRLRPQDEAKFIELLTAVYGQSYSYQNLYLKGEFAALLQSGKLISYGEFTPDHHLVSHSGFWVKEQEGDYAESGVSFRLPHTNLAATASDTQQEWQNAFMSLAQKYSFIHQQCTTWHPLAQRYAKKYMRAQTCGVIMNYVENERLQGIQTDGRQMHSLIMTTVLNPFIYPVKTAYVPPVFFDWIQNAYSRLVLPVQLKPCSDSHTQFCAFSLHLLEDNACIQLQRRRVIFNPDSSSKVQNIPFASCKTDLIHVPMSSDALMADIVPLLIRQGYFPCGIRPHIYQDDELIFQRIKPYQSQLGDWLNDMKIACKSTKEWLAQWHILIQQILSTDC